ncbi:MAG TPA: DUF2085 domain-containing protein [Candidatus Thalassarchaeaceae archaeon]|jgi:uncharacterized membrane protein|nr:DUF2085 domain-containing protein [Candidatus Thalassarchaeaceae archaeon]|tara:strand:+ start:39254 stop:40012 length:759 start_codon:yes stop_codon:yes gene_type:complete
MGREQLHKNGLSERLRESKISRTLGGISAGFIILCFIAPATLPEGFVPELSGRANAIDYAYHDSWGNQDRGEDGRVGHNQSLHGGTFAWTELNPFFALAYGFGDINCHQKHERSWEINHNQIPLCARDVGIFLGFTIGCLIFGIRGYNRWTVRDTFLSILPDESTSSLYEKDRRLIAVLAIMGLGLIPMGIDGFTQLLLSSYESNNPLRLVTGTVAGIVGGWWFCSAFSARPKYFQGPNNVILPADAKLVTK